MIVSFLGDKPLNRRYNRIRRIEYSKCTTMCGEQGRNGKANRSDGTIGPLIALAYWLPVGDVPNHAPKRENLPKLSDGR